MDLKIDKDYFLTHFVNKGGVGDVALLIDEYNEKWIELAIANRSKETLAYILATCWWEAGKIFKPIPEIKDSKRKAVQDKYWDTGFYGRGYVQITWKTNYEKFSKLLGIDLVAHPDLALQSEYAAYIMFYGMFYGEFTGKKLKDYITTKKVDYLNARRIVNGMDQATTIKKKAQEYERILRIKGTI